LTDTKEKKSHNGIDIEIVNQTMEAVMFANSMCGYDKTPSHEMIRAALSQACDSLSSLRMCLSLLYMLERRAGVANPLKLEHSDKMLRACFDALQSRLTVVAEKEIGFKANK